MSNLIGTHIYYLVTIYDELGNYSYFVWANDTSGNYAISPQRIFQAFPEGANLPPIHGDPTLISNLLTNTTEEDLICFNGTTFDPDVDSFTFTYNWLKNGQSIYEVLMPFNTQNPAYIKDYSNKGNHGTLVGPTWSSNGVIGGCYFYGGASDYISIPLPNVFYDIPNNDFTISIWFNATDISEDNSVALTASLDNSNFIKIFLQGTEIHAGIVWEEGKDQKKTAVRTENLNSNTWYHIAVTWEAYEKEITIYCNGIPYYLAGYREFAMGVGDGLFEIGHGSASSKFWDGYIDELQVYSHALSDKQIFQIYLCQKNGYSEKMVFVSEETSIYDIWQCIVTANDGYQDGAAKESNILEVLEYVGD
jgi:hypothetical protein